MTHSPPDQIILYGRPACPMLPPVQSLLKEAQIDHLYIDIWQDETGRQRVREINHGHESVPTLEFPDGTTLTEPRPAALLQKLRELGYEVPETAAQRARVLGSLTNPLVLIPLIFLFFAVIGWLLR